uniref:alpha-L-fucosidase n=1 Tax=uncultured bacterium Contig1756 TaxID=1393499 RepID=W0FH53_9BACT|nr:alpha-L-fucosidase [uncultured bacterium Contig1756]
MSQHFEPTFDSLRTYSAPEWFRDAKFGIWSHWGPQSVPMFGDWYARNMYIEGTQQYEYHVRHYGHPSRFGYKDICALWKAEKFDPEALIAKYYKAGARYLMTQATHHDHFFNYGSSINRMNSVNVGPKKDILALWKAAADRYGMPFGLSEHLGASFSWWRVNKGCDKHGPYAGVPYDGTDPAYRDFYHANEEHGTENPLEIWPWYTDNREFQAYWLRCVEEMIDRFRPDLVYTDGVLPFGGHWMGEEVRAIHPEDYRPGLQAVAKLYNTSIETYGENRAVYLQKDRRPEIYSVGVLDIEKSQLPGIMPEPWHTDTCIGNWFYDVHHPYKSPEQITEMLVDIISKNGVMLLNILQRPDGTIDEDAEFILDRLADWYAVNGEAVYGTRPWRVFGEGDTRVKIDGFTEEKTDWNRSDFRFVQKDGAVYAFMMGAAPGEAVVLRSFAEQPVQSVELLGCGPVPFRQEFGLVTVSLPEKLPSMCANTLKIR